MKCDVYDFEAERDALKIDNDRLRGLVKGAEWVGNGSGSAYCLYCGSGFYAGEAQAKHKTDCMAFTPTGVVR